MATTNSARGGVSRLSTRPPRVPPNCHALMGSLCDKESGIRDEAAKALGSIGPTAAKAIPSLAHVMCDASSDLQLIFTCAKSLTVIGSNGVSALIDVICANKDNCLIPMVCSAALANLGSDAAPPVIEMLRDPTDAVRDWAAKTLIEIGADAIGAVPVL